MAKYPQVIQASAKQYAPNMIVDYLKDFASLFHSLWSTDIKLVDETNERNSKSMMAFVTCVKTVIKNALQTIFINAPEKM
jgi:arginyl-tRNA synthetase